MSLNELDEEWLGADRHREPRREASRSCRATRDTSVADMLETLAFNGLIAPRHGAAQPRAGRPRTSPGGSGLMYGHYNRWQSQARRRQRSSSGGCSPSTVGRSDLLAGMAVEHCGDEVRLDARTAMPGSTVWEDDVDVFAAWMSRHSLAGRTQRRVGWRAHGPARCGRIYERTKQSAGTCRERDGGHSDDRARRHRFGTANWTAVSSCNKKRTPVRSVRGLCKAPRCIRQRRD